MVTAPRKMGYGSYTQLVIYGELLPRRKNLVSHRERWLMRTSSDADRPESRGTARNWLWWTLPPMLRWYVALVPCLAAAGIGVAAVRTDWHSSDLEKFLLLVCCGMLSVAATPRLMYRSGGVTMDFTTVWVLPTAILLPPVYAALIPIPMFAVMQFWVHRGILHRTVFTAASVSVSYAVVSLVFRLLPSSFAGETVGSGLHAFTWALVVVASYAIGGRLQYLLIVGAVKLSDRQAKISVIELDRNALQGRFVEIDLGALITLAVAISPALVVVALPTVLLVRRFLVHPVLVAQSRVDAKTGLLNMPTWEREAEAELSRAVRTHSAMAIALVDIDHFKAVNDTYGHLVGDRVLKALADALTGQLRGYDRAGRFGGEEFVLLLAQATENEACRIAERLRRHVGEMAVPVSDAPGAARVRLTISIGVTAMAAGRSRELADMLSTADSALYRAKQDGRNKVALARYVLDAELPAGASLGLRTLL